MLLLYCNIGLKARGPGLKDIVSASQVQVAHIISHIHYFLESTPAASCSPSYYKQSYPQKVSSLQKGET